MLSLLIIRLKFQKIEKRGLEGLKILDQTFRKIISETEIDLD
jgi:hypothetical protein